MEGTRQNGNIREDQGTLAQMLYLIKIVKGTSVSQVEFVEQLPQKIRDIFFGGNNNPNRTVLSMFFNSKQKHKLAESRYADFLKQITDKNTLDSMFFTDLKRRIQYYVNQRKWKQFYPREYYKELQYCIPDNVDECMPIEVVVYLWRIYENEQSWKYSYRKIMYELLQLCLEEDTPEEEVLELISYGVLLSIFPDANMLNGYVIPYDMDGYNMDFIPELDREKLLIFRKHEALTKIHEIMESEEPVCYLVGSAGSGKESIIKAYELQLREEKRRAIFYYYDFEYNIFGKIKKNTIAATNIQEILNDIQIKRGKYRDPMILVINRWNGQYDDMFWQISSLGNINSGCQVRFIFITENELVVKNVKNEMLINLNDEYLKSRQWCACQLFRKSLGLPRSISSEKEITKILEHLDWHFFSTKLLAQIMKERSYSFEDIEDGYRQSGRLLKNGIDILPYMRNLGLDSLKSSVYDFLVCASSMAEENKHIDRDFYFLMSEGIEKWDDFEKTYKAALKKSLIIENKIIETDKVYFRVRPHIRQAILALNDSIQNQKFMRIVIKVAETVNVFDNNIYKNKYSDYMDDIKGCVENILKVIPYKAGQFTGAYVNFTRFLRIVEDKPKTALEYLRNMEKSIQREETEILKADLAIVHNEMGKIYELMGEEKKMEQVLKETDRFYAIQSTDSSNMRTFARAIESPFAIDHNGRILDNLYTLKNAGVIGKKYYETKTELARLMTRGLKRLEYQDQEDVYRAAIANINEAIGFFENNGQEDDAALATALFVRAVLNRTYAGIENNPQLQLIIDDLSHAEKIQNEIWGVYHSKQIPIYLEKAEISQELFRKEETEEYLRLIRDIRMKNREIEFAPNQRKRIKDLKQKIS